MTNRRLYDIILENFKERIAIMKKINLKTIGIYLLRWTALGLLMGVICGGLGAVFSKAIHAATALRGEYPWLLYLLPLGGLLTIGLYRLCKVSGMRTMWVMESARSEKKVSPLLVPAIFGGTVLTHLFGGSAGKEGAALQLGGGIAAWLSKIFKLEEQHRRSLVVAGMGAFFAALFGTPLGAVAFVFEVLRIGKRAWNASYPTIVAVVTSYGAAKLCGAHWEYFSFTVPAISGKMVLVGLLIIAAAAAAAMLFCYSLRWGKQLFERWFKNEVVRILFGAGLIILLTHLVGSYDYNGGGMEIIEKVFQGQVRYEAFALKMLFTVVTAAADFKGGEIVPSLFIGATLGGALASLFGINIGFGGALGMIALLSGVTNAPIACALIGAELFQGQGIGYLALASVLGWLLTYRISFYTYLTKEQK